MTTAKPFLLFFLLVSILSLSNGCATLPNVSEKIDDAPAEQKSPQIVSSKGLLSPQKSKAIMERLKRSVDPTDILERHNAVVESVTESPLTKGNKVTLLADGQAAYAAMFKAIENAKDHINLETFIIEDDEVGRKFADLLLQKQAEGVQVNLIYDSVGSYSTPRCLFSAPAGRWNSGGRIQSNQSVKGPRALAPGASGPPQDFDHRRQSRHFRGYQYQFGLFKQSFRKERSRRRAAALA